MSHCATIRFDLGKRERSSMLNTSEYSRLKMRHSVMLICATLWLMGARSSCSGDGEPSRTVCTENSHCESWFGPDEVCDVNENVCLPPDQAHPGNCGDNRVTGLEDCDQGTNPPQDCSYGSSWGCDVCNGSCQEVSGIAHYCGDGVLDSGNGEVCDDHGQPAVTIPAQATVCVRVQPVSM